MNAYVWHKNNWFMIDLVAPKDKSPTPSSPTVMTAEAMKVYVFDPSEQSKVSVHHTAGETTLTVEENPGWIVGDRVELISDDTLRQTLHISSLPAANQIAYGETTSSDSSIGARVIKKLSPDLTGAAYGTAATDTTTWGFVKFISPAIDTFYEPPFDLDHLLIEAALLSGGIPSWQGTYNVTIVEPLR